MSDTDLTVVLLIILILLGLGHLLGSVFVRFRQPRVVGEILAGVLIGPAVLGHFPSFFWTQELTQYKPEIFGFLYWLGLLLLMFLSGVEARGVLNRDERKVVALLTTIGTGIPFVLGLILGPWLITPALEGPQANRMSLTIIIAIGIAVTSIPVVSKIFMDLKIFNTRFARLILGVAVLEDIVLWLALAIATAVATNSALGVGKIGFHIVNTVIFFALGLTIVRDAIKRVNASSKNRLAQETPVAYIIALLFTYCVVAGTLGVSMVFAAFLAGFAVAQNDDRLFCDALNAISKVSFAVFVPLYFALVGLRLDLRQSFSWRMVLLFLCGSCIVKILSVSTAAWVAGFRGLAIINLAVTTNARGGPGIVLASVAFDTGIISAAFYTALVVAAVVTSQMSGAWLDYILRRGRPLLNTVLEPEKDPRRDVNAVTRIRLR